MVHRREDFLLRRRSIRDREPTSDSGGRVVHHLKHAIQEEANIIALVGFQAEPTLGRKLIEEWETVPI